jgi:hypothetical protein
MSCVAAAMDAAAMRLVLGITAVMFQDDDQRARVHSV